jgi:hypothetical protein
LSRLAFQLGFVAFLLADVLQRFDGTDHPSVGAVQRRGRKIQPPPTTRKQRKVILGLPGAGDQGRGLVLAGIELRHLADRGIQYQVGHHRPWLGIKWPPVLPGADHLLRRHACHRLAGAIPVRDAVLCVNHEHRHWATLHDFRQEHGAVARRAFGFPLRGYVAKAFRRPRPSGPHRRATARR